MIPDIVQQGDVGTRFLITVTEDGVAKDISAATTKKIVFDSPTGTVSEKVATFLTDGTDGKLYYDTLANDLSTSGVWQVQAYIVTSTAKWHTEAKKFTVAPNLGTRT